MHALLVEAEVGKSFVVDFAGLFGFFGGDGFNAVHAVFFSSRRRHTMLTCDWSSDVCSSDLFDGLKARTPQLYLDVDREKVKTMGVPLNNVFEALQAYMGSYYVNDFNRFGRTWQVNI